MSKKWLTALVAFTIALAAIAGGGYQLALNRMRRTSRQRATEARCFRPDDGHRQKDDPPLVPMACLGSPG